MPLTATQVKQTKPRDKTYKLFDGGGMYLEVSPKGGKWWRLKYRIAGKEKRISLGTYPTVSLKEARDHRETFKKQITQGIDPSLLRQIKKYEAKENTFKAVALEWFAKHRKKVNAQYADRLIRRLEKDIFPLLGNRLISEITPPELLSVLSKVEKRGAIVIAKRLKQTCGQVFRYAVATGRAERDPTQDLKGALTPNKTKSFASLRKPAELAALLNSIDGYTGTIETRLALQLLPLIFVRPGELRHAEWKEMDWGAKEWHIPEEKMKMKEKHIVPLSTQAITILEALMLITGKGKYLFPSVRTRSRPMSENTLNAALRRMGYTKEEMTSHGFRSTASTLLNEQGWDRDWIERQLAHAERDSVRAAYNYAQYLPQRKEMMQAWADYLDGLKQGADVVSIHSRVKVE